MNSADETAAKLETTESASVVPGSDKKLDGQAAFEDLQGASQPKRPVEGLHNLLLRISHHLDYEMSERKNIYYRLLAIDGQTKKALESQAKNRASRTFVRYMIAIGIGVGGTLAWQSYGDATKQIVATTAPELGWSPESKQMIASWIQEIGWSKPRAGSEDAAAHPSMTATQPTLVAPPETVASQAPAPSFDSEQVGKIATGLDALRQSVDQIATGQDQMAREITKLLAADVEILLKIPTPPPPQPTVAPARKPLTTQPTSSHAPARAH